VIGGGNSGVEAAIDLAGIVSHVTLLEFDSKLRADAVLQAKLGSLPNVTIITSALTTEVTGDGEKVNGIVYQDRNSGQVKRVELEGIFVQIGLLPNTDWLKGHDRLVGARRDRDRCARPDLGARHLRRRRRDDRRPTSRSSSPWATERRPACPPSIT
jgi:alkyl hydroperoxide reductase subunit AhpF